MDKETLGDQPEEARAEGKSADGLIELAKMFEDLRGAWDELDLCSQVSIAATLLDISPELPNWIVTERLLGHVLDCGCCHHERLRAASARFPIVRYLAELLYWLATDLDRGYPPAALVEEVDRYCNEFGSSEDKVDGKWVEPFREYATMQVEPYLDTAISWRRVQIAAVAGRLIELAGYRSEQSAELLAKREPVGGVLRPESGTKLIRLCMRVKSVLPLSALNLTGEVQVVSWADDVPQIPGFTRRVSSDPFFFTGQSADWGLFIGTVRRAIESEGVVPTTGQFRHFPEKATGDAEEAVKRRLGQELYDLLTPETICSLSTAEQLLAANLNDPNSAVVMVGRAWEGELKNLFEGLRQHLAAKGIREFPRSKGTSQGPRPVILGGRIIEKAMLGEMVAALDVDDPLCAEYLAGRGIDQKELVRIGRFVSRVRGAYTHGEPKAKAVIREDYRRLLGDRPGGSVFQVFAGKRPARVQ